MAEKMGVSLEEKNSEVSNKDSNIPDEDRKSEAENVSTEDKISKEADECVEELVNVEEIEVIKGLDFRPKHCLRGLRQ